MRKYFFYLSAAMVESFLLSKNDPVNAKSQANIFETVKEKTGEDTFKWEISGPIEVTTPGTVLLFRPNPDKGPLGFELLRSEIVYTGEDTEICYCLKFFGNLLFLNQIELAADFLSAKKRVIK